MNNHVKKVAIGGAVVAGAYIAKKAVDFMKIRSSLGNILVEQAEMPANVATIREANGNGKRPKVLDAKKPKVFNLKQAALLGEGIFTKGDKIFA